MAEYKVPQNVDIEDRVIGPLTLRQFIFILVAVGVDMVMYFTLVGFLRPLFWILALVITGAAIGLAFGKYGDQHLEVFALSAIKTLLSPKKRIWKKEADTHQMTEGAGEKEKAKAENKKEAAALDPVKAYSDLERLAAVVDAGEMQGVAQKDRVVMGNGANKPQEKVLDPLSQTEQPNKELDTTITTAGKSAPKRDPLVSELAKVSPGKQFNYNQVDVRPEAPAGAIDPSANTTQNSR